VNAKTRKRLWERDGGLCWHCGTADGLSVQHRSNRGMGGDPKGLKDRPSNLILLCWESNTQLESVALFARTGTVQGWKISQHADSTKMPVWNQAKQSWILLDDEWGFIVVPD